MLRILFPKKKMVSLKKDEKGVAAIEFAVIVPVLVLLFLFSVSAVFALSAQRRVAISVNAMGDLATRAGNVNTAEITGIANLGRLILTPFAAAAADVLITHFRVNPSGAQGTVLWSRFEPGTGGPGGGSGLAALPAGSNFPFTNLLPPDDFIVEVQMVLPQTSFFDGFLETETIGATFLSHQERVLFNSRTGNEIICSDC